MTADYEHGVLAMLSGLLDSSHFVAFKDIPNEVNRCAGMVGLQNVAIFIADMQEEVLRELTGVGVDAHGGAAEQQAVEGTLAGRAFQFGRSVPHPLPSPDEHRWWVPLLNGTERLGVLRVDAGDGRNARRSAELLASMVALVMVGRSHSSDAYPRLRRTETMSVAAELQWHLMPPRTYADDDVVIGAVMEPAYRVGGDAFDFAVTDEMANLAVFDSMGHDASAGVAANLAVAACRNARRQGDGLVETSVAIERTLIEEFHRFQFVTAVLAQLNTRTGDLIWVNRGHPAPIIIRGHRWSNELECPPAHPMGADLGSEPTLCHVQLEPGDRIVLYTDGITEERDDQGEFFGIERFTDFLIKRHADELSVPETLRRLIYNIRDHHMESLTDDATVLLAEWVGSGSVNAEQREKLAGLPRPEQV